MIPRLLITDRQFGLLASGDGDPETLATLLAGRLSKNILMIRAVIAQARQTAAPQAARALEDAYSLLARVQRRHPESVAAALSSPNVSLWAASCLRSGPTPDYGYLSCVAASAALRAGVPCEIGLPAPEGGLPLPGLGTVVAPLPGPVWLRGDSLTATLTTARERIEIPVPPPGADGAAVPGWRPACFLRASADGVSTEVQLDDRDPYRAPHQLLWPRPASPAQPSRWQSVFEDAWSELVRRHRPHAEGMAVALRVLVPLAPRDQVHGNSATALDAFGTVLLTPPDDPSSLALTLLHEFQHGKLAALHDIVPLHRGDSGRRYYAPWRDDPRPLGGLLQGAYAHIAVCEFWRARWMDEARTDTAAPLAQARLLACRDDVHEAVSQLTASGQLTEAGERFVAGIAAAVDAQPGTPASGLVSRIRDDLRASDRIAWRIAHLHPDHAAISRLARSWLSRGDARTDPATAVPVTLSPGARGPRGSLRLQLATRSVLAPPDRPPADCGPDTTPGAADLEYAHGRHDAARTGYLSALVADPEAPGAWTGLALSTLRLARTAADRAAADLLCRRPELIRAVYLHVRALDGTDPDPVALAAWISDSGRECDTLKFRPVPLRDLESPWHP